MRPSFGGFPALELPSERVVLTRDGTFAQAQKILRTTAAGILPLISLPPMGRSLWRVLARGLANPGAATNASAIDFLALSGLAAAQVIGRARLTTDQNDDGAVLQSIGANTPVWFELRCWRSVDDRLNIEGIAWGGLLPGFSGTTLASVLGLPARTFVTTASVVDGPIDLALLAITATTAAFTLDGITVFQTPDPLDMMI